MLTPKDLFQRIRRIEIKTNRLVEGFLQGKYRSAFKGKGMEFEEVRPYEPGDDVRAVDWNVTARFGHPYVKTFREERELTVLLAVDISRSLDFGSVDWTKKEMVAEIAAVLAFSAMKNNDKVGLLLFTDRTEKYIPPRTGMRHILRIIRDLLAFQAVGTGTDIAHALNYLGSVQKKAGVCFFLSDFFCEADYLYELKLIARRHDFIAIHLQDPLERVFPDIGVTAVREVETDRFAYTDTSLREVREQLALEAEEHAVKVRAGIKKARGDYLPLSTDEAYFTALRKYFTLRGRRK